MITFERVSVRYPDAAADALRDVDLTVEEGQLCLVVGRTGAGKSTLLGTVNGLVPHFTGGTLAGRVTVAGRDTRTHRPRELADVVGVVGQDPLAGFVTDTVEEELAYGMEQLGLASPVMRTRVEETLDLLGIAGLRARSLRTLSGGEQQRVAIGAVLTAQPRVLVLDEPTSALDPGAAEEVLATVTRLVGDLGLTVLLAEHRLERVVHCADAVVHVDPDGTVTSGEPAAMLATTSVAPPVVQLGRLAGWAPLPLSVRDARRRAAPLRDRLAGLPAPEPDVSDRPAALRAERVVVRHGRSVAVAGVSLTLAAGRIDALMGRNGAGKSSLLWALQGTGPRQGGRVTVTGDARVALVPQTPSDLLYLDTVALEGRTADAESGAATGSTAALLAELAPGIAADTHPRDLSEGQRLALALAVQLAGDPPVLLLDEPTRGLDYGAKERLGAVLRRRAAAGAAVLVATHDVEFVAATCERVLLLAEGELVAEGSSGDILAASPLFAPQVAKIVAPHRWLTVEQVSAGLAR